MKYKIFYIGLNTETLVILSQDKNFEIIGVNYFDYFDYFTLNPIDYIFKLVYFWHFKQKHDRLISLFLNIWISLSFFSSKLYRNNKIYLKSIINNKIKIINTEEVDNFSCFLLDNKTDLIIINSWGIIPNKILDLPKYKSINIHPSILPQYRGSLPTLWSLKNNDKESALTYIVLNQFIDDGDIIGQHLFKIGESDNWYDIEKKISLILNNTLNTDILKYLTGNYLIISNNMKPSNTGFYNKYTQIILTEESSKDIYNKVGLYPFLEPFFYCYIIILNKKIYIKKILYSKKLFEKNKIGRIFLGFGLVYFYTKDGILKSYLFKDINFSNSFFIIFNKIFNKI